MQITRTTINGVEIDPEIIKAYTHANTHRGVPLGSETMDWLFKNIPLGFPVLELGSGLGSHVLGHFYQMTCVENSEEWTGKYTNIDYIHAPLVGKWYDPEIVETYLPKEYACVIIDGPRERHLIEPYLSLFHLHVPWIVDDSETHRGEATLEAIMRHCKRPYKTYLAGEDRRQKEFAVVEPMFVTEPKE
jgi:hypothetical protein